MRGNMCLTVRRIKCILRIWSGRINEEMSLAPQWKINSTDTETKHSHQQKDDSKKRARNVEKNVAIKAEDIGEMICVPRSCFDVCFLSCNLDTIQVAMWSIIPIIYWEKS